MNVLLVGSGGREHALAWKIAQSPQLDKLWIAPGNPGTALYGKNIPLAVDDVNELVHFASEHLVDLVVIGPEASLAAGLADACKHAGIAVFGPDRLAAQIETSKGFSKQFMQRHGIPTAKFAVFNALEPALAYLSHVDTPIVIKASGLASGKGVILPDTIEQAATVLQDMLENGVFGAAGEEVIIEERLVGPEVSLLAFCDGQTLKLIPPAQDHKRLLDDDQGPNTGGMGAYAPAPVCPPELQAEILRTVLEPTARGLKEEGMPFVGVLYGGMILTPSGPKALEFNARFGDPETQAILPLLKSDLLSILAACTQGKLAETPVEWSDGAAVCVVMSSVDYPMKSSPAQPISGLDQVQEDCVVFQAGTKVVDNQLVSHGGRVLGVTGLADTLPQAVQAAYKGVETIKFQGAHYRKDIAQRALSQPAASDYRSAGVDIEAGNRAVQLIRQSVLSTHTAQVLSGLGSFGGLFDAAPLQKMEQPILVASTDGVGTKVKLAAALGRYHGIGMDIVNHCINDILVQGAKPLFFLDYYATSKLEPEHLAQIVSGMAQACREAGCAILGGETAEMPGVYVAGEFDVAGTIVGVLEKGQLLPKTSVQPGDVVIGLASVSPHTNGYSLLRKLYEAVDLQQTLPGSGQSYADALLTPHRSYLNLLWPVLTQVQSPIKALAHLTGGGFIENIPRVLPADCGVEIEVGSWPVLPIFKDVQARGNISITEMHRVFNMGIGMVAIVAADKVAAFQALLPEQTWQIGTVTADPDHKVVLRQA